MGEQDSYSAQGTNGDQGVPNLEGDSFPFPTSASESRMGRRIFLVCTRPRKV